MHVLYFLLKKLMEPPFSEYLVLLKNRVTFSYSFINFFFDFNFFFEKNSKKIRIDFNFFFEKSKNTQDGK
jgi:hypothetical protein